VRAIDALKLSTKHLIGLNPVTVTIQRVSYAEGGDGGRSETKSTLPPFEGRFIPFSRFPTKEFVDDSGRIHVASWWLLAPPEADVQAGSRVTDTCTVIGRTYRALRVMPRAYEGEIFGYHVLLAEVG
jgi:hypothetical protein